MKEGLEVLNIQSSIPNILSSLQFYGLNFYPIITICTDSQFYQFKKRGRSLILSPKKLTHVLDRCQISTKYIQVYLHSSVVGEFSDALRAVHHFNLSL